VIADGRSFCQSVALVFLPCCSGKKKKKQSDAYNIGVTIHKLLQQKKTLSHTLHFLIDVDSDFKLEMIENHLKSGRYAKVSVPFKSLSFKSQSSIVRNPSWSVAVGMIDPAFFLDSLLDKLRPDWGISKAFSFVYCLIVLSKCVFL
jgi:hypothetical protein